MSSTPPRGRGRPRQFDPTAALDAALRVFWTRGYAGTSIDDLTTAMGMNRPSVYAAFGNKEALYAAAVRHYVATIGARYVAPLARGRSLAADLNAFFAAQIDGVTGRHGPLGCIVACTLPAEAGVSRAMQRELAAAIAQVDAALLARFRAARAAGEIAPHADVTALAKAMTSAMFAISIRARAGAPRRELSRLAKEWVRIALDAAAP